MIRQCKKCHVETERYKSGKCIPCKKASGAAWYKANSEKHNANAASWAKANPEKRRDSVAAWAKANPEKVKASNAAWLLANVERKKDTNAAWRKANPEREKSNSAAWKNANPERVKSTTAARYKANPEKSKANSAAWKKSNPEKLRIIQHNRRAKQRANGGKLSSDLSTKLFNLQRGKCPCCGKPLGEDYHLDHIIPIKLGGANEDSNIQLLTKTCNLKKNAKHPVEFMQSKGFLL